MLLNLKFECCLLSRNIQTCLYRRQYCHLFPSQLHHFTIKSEYVELEYHDLFDVCQSTSEALTISEGMAEQVELQTRQQAKSNLWYKFRAGRITVSNMKAVCCTDSANPSKSLIKRICYPLLPVNNLIGDKSTRSPFVKSI